MTTRCAGRNQAAVVELASGRYDLVVFDVSLKAPRSWYCLACWAASARSGDRHIARRFTPRARECARELGIRLLLVKPYRLPAVETVRFALTNGYRQI
jgi:hypothetical protein